jgi:hypothetical protein
MDENLRLHVGIDDYILFRPSNTMHSLRRVRDDVVVGRIVGSTSDAVEVSVFETMTSVLLQHYSLPPVTSAVFPMASQSCMLEVVAQEARVSVARSNICDVAFVIPIYEVESGLFHLSGSYNSFFIRYFFLNGAVHPYGSELYFSARNVEPVTFRLFHSLNALAHLVKKSLYHQGEAELSMRSFRLYLSTEAFSYFYNKLYSVSVTSSTSRKQAVIMYYDSLTIEARTKIITKTYLRIVTKQGLSSLQKILGVGVGLGIVKKRPTSKVPLVYCTEGSFLTSVEVQENLPDELVAKPLQRFPRDGVDFIYTEESRQLTCNIRYSKIKINNRETVTSRMPTAEVHEQLIGGAYLDSHFHYNGDLMTVVNIANDTATCRHLHYDSDSDEDDEERWELVDLPLDLVRQLVSSFGK